MKLTKWQQIIFDLINMQPRGGGKSFLIAYLYQHDVGAQNKYPLKDTHFSRLNKKIQDSIPVPEIFNTIGKLKDESKT